MIKPSHIFLSAAIATAWGIEACAVAQQSGGAPPRVVPQSEVLRAGFVTFTNTKGFSDLTTEQETFSPFEKRVVIDGSRRSIENCPNEILIGGIKTENDFSPLNVDVTTIILDTKILVSC